MSRLTDIKAKINVLEGGAFQELCDALLARKGYDGIHAYGMQAGTMKTTKGNPDTYFKSKNGKYIFVAYTTQKDNLFEKAKDHLGMSIDTNQILEQRDFIDRYDSNEMLAPLSTTFQFRKDEYEEMMSFLQQKK